jgi:acyl-CoA synthetase (AMP-forming)/AMP-acid ligase II
MQYKAILQQNALLFADKNAFVCGDESITYCELYSAAMSRARELAAGGMSEGDIIPLRAVPTIEYFVEYFAIHLNNGVAVPLASDISDETFRRYNDELQKSKVPEGIADILFTTGTTGKSKGVIISHEAVMANSENLIEAHKYDEDLSFIICGPLNHYGSWSKVFPCIIKGMTVILLDGIKIMDDLFGAIDSAEGRVATFMVPSSIKILMLMSSEKLSEYADKIAFIETGGAPMSESDMKHLCQLLPHSSLYNTYASTESGIVTTYDYSSQKCIPGCVGVPMRNSSVMVSADGHIMCSGKTLMSGYLNDPLLTSRILKDGVVKMTDRGRIDEEGRLHIMGRDDDIINTGAFKVNPQEVEDAANEYAGIKECICVAAPHVVLGTALKLLYTTHDDREINIKDLAEFLKSKLEKHQIPLMYEKTAAIKMTYNGKKDRKYYKMD